VRCHSLALQLGAENMNVDASSCFKPLIDEEKKSGTRRAEEPALFIYQRKVYL
jgi:hypothetical protein